MTDRIPRATKTLVAQRAGFCCEYCGSPAGYCPDPFSIEHVAPRCEGGPNSPDNLAYACLGCNNHKYSRTHAVDPITGETVRLYHPRNDQWADHFAWSQDATWMIGITSVGRATIEALHLNRVGVVNLRRALRLVSEEDLRVAADEAHDQSDDDESENVPPKS